MFFFSPPFYFFSFRAILLTRRRCRRPECARAQTLPGILITMPQSRGVSELQELSGLLFQGATHYITIPGIRLLQGLAQGHGGGGGGGGSIVPHSMRASPLLQANRKRTPRSLKKKPTKIKAPTMRRCTGMTRLTWRGEDDKWEEREGNANEAGP